MSVLLSLNTPAVILVTETVLFCRSKKHVTTYIDHKTRPHSVFLGFSALTTLRPGRLSRGSWSGKPKSRYVLEMHIISNLCWEL